MSNKSKRDESGALTSPQLIKAIESFLCQYSAFPPDSAGLTLALALWAVSTWVYPLFDSFPYLVITSATKRSGKTRLSELLAFLCYNAKPFSAMTPASLFRTLKDAETDGGATIFFDEAETLSGESASMMRAVLNVGYRRGQTIPRVTLNKVEEFPVYSPKVFVLIGDVYDTLRDRSIMVSMVRGTPPAPFYWNAAKAEADLLCANIDRVREEDVRAKVAAQYETIEVAFLKDREAELWRPLLSLCRVLCPERYAELCRVAVDKATEKTVERVRFVNLAAFETEAENDEYGKRLLADLRSVFKAKEKVLYTQDAIARLRALDLAPWRKFRGDGLTPHNLADLLSRFGLRPRLAKVRGKVARGYRRKDVENANAKL